MKRLIAYLMLLSVALSCVNLNVFAATPEKAEVVHSANEILDAYYSNLRELKINAELGIGTYSNQQVVSLKQQTIRELENAGYSALDVNPLTFEAAEDLLDTDLEAMNLDKDYSYIIVVEGDRTGDN